MHWFTINRRQSSATHYKVDCYGLLQGGPPGAHSDVCAGQVRTTASELGISALEGKLSALKAAQGDRGSRGTLN